MSPSFPSSEAWPAAPSGAPAVSLRGLTRVFNGERAVDALTFDVAPGELFGVVGPDGAGKTTTLRMLAGVLRPTGGEAWVAGVDAAREPERVKPHIAYMSQRFGLYEDLTVRENLDFYADLYSVPKAERPERLERLYAFSRLGEFEDRLAGKLSGGMKQKLSLSCSLVHHPDVLLLDEPTFGVDPISRRDLWLILHEMVSQGVTVVVSTSYLDEAERCDRVVLLHEGRALALDEPARLQASLQGTLVAVRTERPREARDHLRRQAGVRSAVLFGQAIHTLLESGRNASDVRLWLDSAGHRVRDTAVVEPSLEDVFIDLVRRERERQEAAA